MSIAAEGFGFLEQPLLILHSLFFIRTSNFGAEAERSYFFFRDLRLKMFLRRS